ncbi:hypothetical protein C8Q74DRAFT_1034955 [Fomes fomentarius]|nr:hypothetical protein C8Q74DRAFT_1034955 [Fomes fomentarius]
MLSSFGFDSKAASRNLNSLSSSRFMPSVPRGFSVHVFKNASMPAHPPQPPMPPIAVPPPKFETIPARPSTGGQWNRQPAYHPSHNDATETQTRKQPAVAAPAPPPSSQEHRLVHIPAANRDHTVNHARPLEKYSKSSKSYGIYPSLTSDIYIYERSISSVSLDDDLASSPYSDDSSNSSDSDLLYSNTATNALAHLDTSSTRASSSTETLESTLTAPRLLPNALSSRQPPPPLPLLAPPRPPSTRPAQEISAPPSARSAPPHSLTRAPDGHLQRTISISHAAAVPPIQLASAPLDVASDSDSETVISETHANDMVVDMLGAQWLPSQAYSSSSYTTPPRSRRDSDARVPSSMHRREPSAQPAPVSRDPRDVPVSRPTQYQRRTDSDEVVHPRAPPGLAGNATVVATAADGSSGGRGMRDVQNASTSSANNISPASRLPTSAPPLARTPTSRPPPPQPSGPQARHPDMGSSFHIPPPSYPPAPSASANAYSSSCRDARTPSPQHSPTNSSPTNVSFTSGAAAQNMNASSQSSPITATSANAIPNAISNAVGSAGAGALVVAAAAAKRSVRWTENLVCPSPVPVENRRKGWFNRRGEQLWTNDGQFKLPEPGQEYPPDLAHYPEPNSGWMNEEGVRIDMQHRLIPKQPLRPALKRSKPLNVNGAQ